MRDQVRSALRWLRSFGPEPGDTAAVVLWTLGVLVALGLRISLFSFEGNDYRYFFGPWVEFIRGHGGVAALGQRFSDYSPAYLYLLALAAYLPFTKVVVIKLVSLLFDLVLAGAVSRVVKQLRADAAAPAIAFLVVLFAPTVLINSAMWGQSDGIYVAFLVLAVLAFLREQDGRASLLYGVAIAFKAQAVFLSPLLLLLFFRRRLKLRHAVLSGVPFVVSLLPAAVLGRSVSGLFLTYFQQAGEYKQLTMGAPNVYQWLPSQPFDMLRTAGIVFTGGVVLLLCLIGVAGRSHRRAAPGEVLHFATVCVLVVPFLLPGMHERYFLPADVISIPFAFCRPAYFWVPVTLTVVSFLSCAPFLLGVHVVDYKYLALALVPVTAIVTRDWVRTGGRATE